MDIRHRPGEAKYLNNTLPFHHRLKTEPMNTEGKNKRKTGDRVMSQHVLLRMDLNENDLLLLIRWMSNENIYRFLNEHQQITSQLKNIYDSRLPVFTPLFNRNGRFYMICAEDGRAIGFLRMKYAPGNAVELVIAIGEEAMWGQGYGRASLAEAQKIAFFEMRRERMIAHIYNENKRSRQLFLNRGFLPCKEGESLSEYQLTYRQYLQPARSN